MNWKLVASIDDGTAQGAISYYNAYTPTDADKNLYTVEGPDLIDMDALRNFAPEQGPLFKLAEQYNQETDPAKKLKLYEKMTDAADKAMAEQKGMWNTPEKRVNAIIDLFTQLGFGPQIRRGIK